MATADDVLNLSRSYLGSPPDQFWAWYPAPAGTAWCCIYQSFILSAVGIPTHVAWVSGLFDQYRANGRTYAPREAQPGDLVAFDYDGSGPSSYDHIAMVESVDPNVGITAINGNWTGKVSRVLHRWDAPGYAGGIAEIARPTYTNTPPPSPQEDDDVASLIMWDTHGTAWHVSGNSRMALGTLDELNMLKFLGVKEVGTPGAGGIPDKQISAWAIIPRNGGINTPGK